MECLEYKALKFQSSIQATNTGKAVKITIAFRYPNDITQNTAKTKEIKEEIDHSIRRVNHFKTPVLVTDTTSG